MLLYIDRMQGTPGSGEETEETGYRVLGLGLVQGAGDHPGGN